MTTHSLILSPHEVRAALAGTLRLVVRPVKPQPFGGDATYQSLNIHGQHIFYPMSEDESVYDKDDGLRRCSLGVSGDRLVCKETWASRGKHTDGHTDMEIEANPAHFSVWYQADCIKNGKDQFNLDFLGRWRSPATMPAWASRITLEVIGVRCARCTEITKEDAKAWGSFLGRCDCPEMNRKLRSGMESMFRQTGCHIHGEEIRHLWQSKYGTRYPWETSWAWAVEVRSVRGCL